MASAPPSPVESLEQAVHQSLRLWHEAESAGIPLQGLHRFDQLQRERDFTLRQTSNQLLLDGLAALAHNAPDEAEVLRLRFDEELPGYAIANRLNVSEGNVWKKQNQGIHRLAQWLWEQEQGLHAGRVAGLQARLELPTYTQLFGVDAALDQLAGQVCHPSPPWLIAIEGLGGMGKTALADALARRLLSAGDWADFAWVTARQQVLNLGGGIKHVNQPALTVEALLDELLTQLSPEAERAPGISLEQRLAILRRLLHDRPHFIVVDNLETQADVDALLDTLRTLAGPTKFLLTTRHRLLGEADVYHFPVPELGAADALALVRHEGAMRNLPELNVASDEELHPIYATVGGNPLALRLVVGQLHVHPLDQVLHDLRQACGQPITNLYTFIYRQAWDGLDEAARQALLLMPLTTEEGATFATLTAMAGAVLDEATLRDALDTLTKLNLVDARGGLYERRYTIHSLTRTFLHQQVLHWGG
jgi:hypothetical protein